MNKKNNEIFNDDSIDLIELLSKIWKGKIFITKSTIIFTLVGIIFSLSLKDIYTVFCFLSSLSERWIITKSS